MSSLVCLGRLPADLEALDYALQAPTRSCSHWQRLSVGDSNLLFSHPPSFGSLDFTTPPCRTDSGWDWTSGGA